MTLLDPRFIYLIMKLFSLLLGALSLSSAMAIQFDSFDSHSDVDTLHEMRARSPVHGSGSGTSSSGSKGKGRGSPVDGDGGSGRAPSPPKQPTPRDVFQGWLNHLRSFDASHANTPHQSRFGSADTSRATRGSGFTGWTQKDIKSPITVCYGDRTYQTADSHTYHEACFPEHAGMSFNAERDGKTSASKRKNFLKKFDKINPFVRDEVLPASIVRDNKITVMPTSKWEGDEQGALLNEAVSQARGCKVPIYFMDTRSSATAGYRGAPYVGRDVPGWNPPAYVVNSEGQYNGGKYGNRYPDAYKRQVGISQIQGQEGPTATGAPDNGTTSQDIQDYIQMWYTAQGNVTELIWPVIEDLVEGTNSTDIHNIAWAVYQMSLPTMSIVGPFMGGLNGFDWLEEQMFGNSSNSTSSPSSSNDTAEYELTLAYHGYLAELYDSAWTNATNAANATGLLDSLYFLAEYGANLTLSQLPSDWNTTDPDPASVDADFFVAWNNGDLANDTSPTVAEFLQEMGMNSTSFPGGLGNDTSNNTSNSTLTKRYAGRHARYPSPVRLSGSS